MKLEDCTKEELIFYIKQNGLLSERELTSEVLFFRADKALEDEHQLYLNADKHFNNYMSLTQPFIGKPVRDIPDDIIKKSAKEFELYTEYSRKSECARKRWRRIQQQIDKLQGR